MTTTPSTAAPKMKDGIVRRGSTWSYVVRERDPGSGKMKPRWVGGFTTMREAKAARDKARNDVARGTYVAPQTVTVGDWLDTWLAGAEVELKPSTVHMYRQKIEAYLKPAIGGERLQSLSPVRLSEVFAKLAKSGGQGGRPLSARTVQQVRAILRRACAVAVVNRVIEVNPVVGSTAPTVTKAKHITWTEDQQRTFLDGVTGRWLPVWVLALATGLRRGELCALRWDDVDLDGGVISVERSTTQLGGELVTTTPKNHETRKVTIDPRTASVLRAFKKQQAEERLGWGPEYSDSGRVVVWENGQPALPDFVGKRFLLDQGGLGLPRMTLHGTRHSHATTLLRNSIPVHIVSKRLGHKDPAVTLNVYADAIPDDDARAVEVFAAAVWGL